MYDHCFLHNNNNKNPMPDTEFTQVIPRSAFLSDFNATQFVDSRLHSGESLESIVRDLKCAVQELTDELLALIDRDHQTFLELSGDLVRVDTTVGTLRGPLARLKEKVVAVKRAAQAPAEAIKEVDEKLASVRARKKLLQEKLHARTIAVGLHRDLLANDETKASQRIALLSRVANGFNHVESGETAELRRELEQRLSQGLIGSGLSKEELAKRLRSFTAMGAVEAARRAVTNDFLHHPNESVLKRVLGAQHGLLEASLDENLGGVFDFIDKVVFPAAKNAHGKIVNSQQARALESTRALLACFSPSGQPSAPVRWNPRMHCELRLQDAVHALESFQGGGYHRRERKALNAALLKLYEEESIEFLRHDLTLAAMLFRMAVRLVNDFLVDIMESCDQGQGKIIDVNEEDDVLERTEEIFILADDLESGTVVQAPEGWNKAKKMYQLLAARALNTGSGLFSALKKVTVSQGVRELNAHERAVTSAYRMSGKPLSEVESSTAGRILVSLRECLSKLFVVRIPEQHLSHFVAEVVCEIHAQYLLMADSVVKRETSLLRLHQRSSQAQRPVMSDSHKILRQLAMDANRFCEDVRQIVALVPNSSSNDELKNYLEIATLEDVVKAFQSLEDNSTA